MIRLRNASLADIMFSFDCVQHVVPAGPSHVDGGTIDLVFTKSNETMNNVVVDAPGVISDHSLINWCLPVQKQPTIVMQRQFRKWKTIDCDAFRSELLESELCDVADLPTSADDYFERYERLLRRLAWRTNMRPSQISAVADNGSCSGWTLSVFTYVASLELEKTYRRTKTSHDRLAWVQHEWKRHAIYRQKEFAHWKWNLRLSTDASSSKNLWRTLGSLMGSRKSEPTSKSCPTAQQLLDFFNAKVEAVRQSTGICNCPVQTHA